VPSGQVLTEPSRIGQVELGLMESLVLLYRVSSGVEPAFALDRTRGAEPSRLRVEAGLRFFEVLCRYLLSHPVSLQQQKCLGQAGNLSAWRRIKMV
jgi:hypothetical protein